MTIETKEQKTYFKESEFGLLIKIFFSLELILSIFLGDQKKNVIKSVGSFLF